MAVAKFPHHIYVFLRSQSRSTIPTLFNFDSFLYLSMYKHTTSGVESLRQIEYIKKKIWKAFSYFDLNNKGYVLKEEVRSVMRYLGQFPSEAQYVNIILPDI
jgi:hypothetical protein